jgi:hypothetical protein
MPEARPPADWFKVYAYELQKTEIPFGNTTIGRDVRIKNLSEKDIEGIDDGNVEQFVRKVANLIMMEFARREIKASDDVELSEDANGIWLVRISWPVKLGLKEWRIFVPLGKNAIRKPDAPSKARQAYDADMAQEQMKAAHWYHIQNKRTYPGCDLCKEQGKEEKGKQKLFGKTIDPFEDKLDGAFGLP